jgi:protein-S-isoprenylcysteine O-methyltransferase Ste14
MMTGIFQTILTLTVILAFYTLDTYFITRFEPKRRKAGSGRNYVYSTWVGVFIICLAAQPVFFPRLGLVIPGLFGLVVQVSGICILSAAMLLHFWARQHLKEFYSERLELLPLHRLVKSGPYASIRHPITASFFLLTVGLLLANPSLPALLILCVTAWYLKICVRDEEKLLSRFLPGYRDYMLHTPAYRPHISKTKTQDARR